MAQVIDVAQRILEKHGPRTAMKLQKLVYYSQAWHLAWREAPLFPERIEAWADGPVVPALWRLRRGAFKVSSVRGADAARLTSEERDVIGLVLSFYGDKNPQWLSDLSHMESPWNEARRGLSDGVASDNEITWESMARYYSSL
jgi:uncharacterized phage-associated protein